MTFYLGIPMEIPMGIPMGTPMALSMGNPRWFLMVLHTMLALEFSYLRFPTQCLRFDVFIACWKMILNPAALVFNFRQPEKKNRKGQQKVRIHGNSNKNKNM